MQGFMQQPESVQVLFSLQASYSIFFAVLQDGSLQAQQAML